LSLQLSFAALVGICLFQPLGHQVFQPQHRIMRWVWEAVLMSVAAQLGTLPLCLYYFHQFPMYFLIANLAILPLMGVLMGGCLWAALWALCAVPPLWLILGLHGLMQGMNFIAEYIGQWPASVITDIPCSKGLALWLTVGVLGLWYMAKTAPTKRIIPIMSWLVFGLMIQLVTKLHTGLTSEWRIVQLRQYSALLVREGFQVRVYTDAPPEVWKSTNMWKAYCLAHQGVQLRLGPLPQAFRTPQGLWLAVDDAAPLLTRSRRVQGIWLRNNAKIHLEWLLQQYHPNTVVIDPSNKPWLGVQWQQKTQELGIRCHYMGQQGSYTVPLR
jgi:competence protein ComEC